MAKNIEDIIVPERRRSIRDIPIPAGRRRADHLTPTFDTKPTPPPAPSLGDFSKPPSPPTPPPPPRPPVFPERPRKSKKKMWLGVLLGVIVLVFAVLSFFNGATLAYMPKSLDLSFESDTFAAQKSGAGSLFYSVVKLSRDKSFVAPAGGEQDVSRKASGVIVVYNDATTEPQRLVENTRFESAGGKVYRIQNAITIPGKKTVSGGSQPGSIEVTVYADQPGAEYNGEPTDFTVPGLKGSPRYETIYARSKTPLSGGFVGKEKAVKPEDLAKTKASLEEALKKELLDEADVEVPEDFVLFPSLSLFSFESLPQTVADGTNVNVNMRGTLYGVMFKRSDLASYLAAKKITLSPGDVVDINSYDVLTLAFAGTPPTDLLTVNDINFKVTGSSKLTWRTDEVALKADLLGKPKSEIENILKNYPAVDTASITVRPFWKGTLPSDVAKVTIKRLPIE